MARIKDDIPILLTPGPLTTSPQTRSAMQRDWGSRDEGFTVLNRQIRARLLALAHATGTHEAIPLQGSGTFCIEAALGTFVPPDATLLVLVNGAYGRRMVHLSEVIGRETLAQTSSEETPVDVAQLDATLAADPAIDFVAVVHCETTTGLLNPIAAIAAVVARHGRELIIDAMSAFGALELDARQVPFGVLVASSNKCLEGVPGVGFALARTDLVQRSAGHAHSVSLDLYAQWKGFNKNGQWRFTPPTHVLAALDSALTQLDEEGGVPSRYARYHRNCTVLIEGMEARGFQLLLPRALQAPIIVTFHCPPHPRFDFPTFYSGLSARGFQIYPGKLTQTETFRIGCIGQVYEFTIEAALLAIDATLSDMGVVLPAPTTSKTQLESPMDLHPSRTYTGPLKAVILDWAGTTLDHGCMAPAVVFIEVYRRKGVEVTMAEARVPMGAHKRVHIQQLGQLPSVQEKWLAAVGRPITEADIDEMFAEFIPLQLACLADYADLIPGTLETIANIRSRGLKIGSTTGYTGEMMGLLLEEARKRGYEPDSSVCATDVPVGRPEPWMCVMNALKLGVFPFEAIVKVDDTLPGIDEGLNAGMWTIGLAMSGNECGLTLEQLEALEPQKRDLMRARAYQRMTAAGAHYVIDSIAELPAVLDAIEIRLAKGERPTDNGSQFWSLQDNTLVNTAAEPRFH